MYIIKLLIFEILDSILNIITLKLRKLINYIFNYSLENVKPVKIYYDLLFFYVIIVM